MELEDGIGHDISMNLADLTLHNDEQDICRVKIGKHFRFIFLPRSKMINLNTFIAAGKFEVRFIQQ